MGYYSAGLRGDYYRGDAGFLSTLANIGSGIASFIPGVGPLVSAGLKGLAGGLEKKTVSAAGAAATAAVVPISKVAGAARPGIMTKAVGLAKAHPVLTAAGAAGVAGAAIGAGGTKLLSMHGMKKHRRMRVTNPKALRRAIRRATGFAHLAKKVLSFTERRPHRGRAVFRKPRRAKRM